MNYINRIFCGIFVLAVILFTFTVVSLTVPWYSIKEPVKVTKVVYFPGDDTELQMDRSALIDIGGRATRELIRIDDEEEYEILTVSQETSIEKGIRRKILYFKLPTIKECPQLKHNSYVWRGHVKYKPFGIYTRTEHFVSEVFHINLGDDVVEYE